MNKIERDYVEVTEGDLKALYAAGRILKIEFQQIPTQAFDRKPLFIVVATVSDAPKKHVLVATRGASGLRIMSLHPSLWHFIRKFPDVDFEPVKIVAEEKLGQPATVQGLRLAIGSGSAE